MPSKKRQDLAPVVLAMLMTAVANPAAAAKIIRFSPPGAIYTNPEAMNDSGSIVGGYVDVSGNRGFLRTPDGTVTLIDEPDSECSTVVAGITHDGVIVGYGGDSNCRSYGFLRTSDGKFTTFSVPGAIRTQVSATNTKGEIIGEYDIDGQSSAGYVRALDGTFQTFAVHGATETVPIGINRKGEVMGHFFDRNNVEHGFLRSVRGKITRFDVPDAGATYPNAINDSGEICGSYYDYHVGAAYTFRRHADGTFELLSSLGNGSAYAINDDGTATGFSTNNGLPLGFIWKSNGTVKTFEPKNSWGVMPSAMNENGAISGVIENEDQTYQAFLRTQ